LAASALASASLSRAISRSRFPMAATTSASAPEAARISVSCRCALLGSYDSAAIRRNSSASASPGLAPIGPRGLALGGAQARA
jgi:hypothetical protein